MTTIWKGIVNHEVLLERGNGSAIEMIHDRISYFLGRNTRFKDKHTNTIKLQIITNFKTLIDFARILAFPHHLHKNLSLRQNWLLRLQIQQLRLPVRKGYFGHIGKELCNTETSPPKCATCQFLKHKRNSKHRKQ